jgi:hypothetical protein
MGIFTVFLTNSAHIAPSTSLFNFFYHHRFTNEPSVVPGGVRLHLPLLHPILLTRPFFCTLVPRPIRQLQVVLLPPRRLRPRHVRRHVLLPARDDLRPWVQAGRDVASYLAEDGSVEPEAGGEAFEVFGFFEAF